MSGIGTSVVNKSGKKVAPKAPPRRRLGKVSTATSNVSPRLSVEASKRPDHHDTDPNKAVQSDNNAIAPATEPSTDEAIHNAVEPAPKRRRLESARSVRVSIDPSVGTAAPAASSNAVETASQSTITDPAQSSQAHVQSSGIPQVLSSPGVTLQQPLATVSDALLQSKAVSSERTRSDVNSTPDDPHVLRTPATDTTRASKGNAPAFVNVVPEVPRQTASQITWNLRTGKTTDEAVGTGGGRRKSTRKAARAADKAVQDDERDAAGIKSADAPAKRPRKGKRQKKNVHVDENEVPTQEDTGVVALEAPTSQTRQSATSARSANQDRRKQKSAAQLRPEDSIITTIEEGSMASGSRHGSHETPAADSDPELDRTATKKQRRPRASTPEGSEAVQIVPSVVTMFELSARNIRTGWKSEREKLMAQIDWGEVKRRRREEENALAQQPRPGSTTNGASNNAQVGDRDGEEDVNENDLDEQLARAVAKNKRKQQTLKIRLVNGEHVVDEASQFVDRHALANGEDDESVEEVEEDDLTKKFNTQSLIRLRRKDPAERVRNWDPWTMELTDRFYDCLRKFGTDFMTIAKCFPGRTRREIKAKFVREERDDPERVHNALTGAATEESWNLESFKTLANMSSDNIIDPRQFEAELERIREEREREIEEQKKETAQLERQKKLAGVDSDDEAEAGAEVSETEKPRRSKKKGAKDKKKREKKRKGHPKDGGDEEEILEDVEE